MYGSARPTISQSGFARDALAKFDATSIAAPATQSRSPPNGRATAQSSAISTRRRPVRLEASRPKERKQADTKPVSTSEQNAAVLVQSPFTAGNTREVTVW